MNLKLVQDNNAAWDDESILFYNKNRDSFFEKDNDFDMNLCKGQPRVALPDKYYRIEDDNEFVGEMKIETRKNGDEEEIDIGIYKAGHNYAQKAIELYIKESKAKTIYAVVKEHNPYLEKMRKILRSIGFEEQTRLQDITPNLIGIVVSDYNFVYTR